MTISGRDLFEKLEPPPGGEAALRRRLAAESARRRLPRPVVLAGAGLAASVVALVGLAIFWWGPRPGAAPELPSRSPSAQTPPSHPTLVTLGLEAAPAESVVVPAPLHDRYAVRRVPVDQPGVEFFLVASSSIRAAGATRPSRRRTRQR